MQAFIIPEPFGGRAMMEEFISLELVYPPAALEHNVEGEVWLKFNVMKDGQVQGLHIWKSLEPSCDEEAMRLARSIQWYPAKVGDVAVDAEHSMVITFSPKTYQKWLKKRNDLSADLRSLPVCKDLSIHSANRVSKPPTPVVPGGSITSWWQKHLKYPPEALRRSIQGPLKVRFIVEPSGNISNLHAVNDLGGGCVTEAFRMLRSLQWSPAVVNNQRVRSQMEMEFIFKLP